MYYKRVFFFLFSLLFSIFSHGQTCGITLKGNVYDVSDKQALERATVRIVEKKTAVQTNLQGLFIFKGICPGKYHIELSHVGCESKTIFVQINADTTLNLNLEHSVHMLHDVHVTGEVNNISTLQTQSLKKDQITENSQSSLSTLLESITGVSSIKNGTISKPVVQGFSGNRLSILNNGVPQNGQQWGSDHAPEIDPLVASKIQVIRGAASLTYPGSNGGNIIIISPENIEKDPHLHGAANYFFETNGLGHGFRVYAQQGKQNLSWRFGITGKNFGDRETPDYYLNNTGNKELNADLLLDKSKNDIQIQVYISTFNAKLGLLRGSQIGNLEDLNVAFGRKEPFFTETTFSRTIDAPSQVVSHNLLKISLKDLRENKLNTEAYVALQSNQRKEFDIRRNTFKDDPSLSLIQNSLHGEYKIHVDKGEKLHLSTGVQAKIVDNTNIAETGILPLLPDFRSIEPSVFAVLESVRKNIHLDLGIRYDGVFQNVKAISFDLPRRIINYDNSFHNFSVSAGFHTKINSGLNLEFQTALGSRNPAVNELYSNGLHQGVAGIELGNTQIRPEKAFKNTLSIEYSALKWLKVKLGTYYNFIDDYIFLQANTEKRLTIRGAFPVFAYQQTDAHITGLDLDTDIKITEHLSYGNQASLIKGRENDNRLVYLPQNRVKNHVNYVHEQIGIKFEISHTYHFVYGSLLPGQDFVAPPAGFGLWSGSAHKEFKIKTNNIKVNLIINNALNTRYRMYLNRLRYYSDDLGRSVVLGVNVGF